MNKKKHDEEQTKEQTGQPAENQTEKQAAPEQNKKEQSIEQKQSLEIEELKDTLQHLQAEFENYKKRCDKEGQAFIKFASEAIIRSLLPIIDNMELAFRSAKQKDDFYKGMELIYAELIDTLESQGVKTINATGKFDPYLHEALLAEESEQENNTILEELQKGYMLNDKVIRHSKVKIAKQKKVEEKKEAKSPGGE